MKLVVTSYHGSSIDSRIAIAGHIGANARVVGLGLALVFLATALMVLGGFAAYEGGETDPRPSDSPFSR